jgi:hypothetical protein
LAFVLAPLARAEANRARRQYDAAVSDIQSVVVPRVVRTIAPPRGEGGPIQQIRMRLANEFIEAPFATLLLAETLLEKADAEYKARTAAAPVPDVAAYQGLKAAQTYLEIKTVLAGDGAYVAHVEAGREALKHDIEQRLVQEDTRSAAFHLLGNDISVPTLTSSSATLPGLDRRLKAHEPLLRVKRPGEPADAGGPAPLMRETNPRVYAVLLTTEARLEQLKAGFNYLGYSDSYVPPWRFQFLLERARYFAEHAKNAQRDYLNFLANAEREEFQELSAAQNVEMEKSNIRVDTARVELARMELAAAEESRQLALLTARNAETRMKDFAAFDQYVDRLFGIEALRQLNDPWQILEEKTGVSALPGPRDVPLISAAGTMLTDFWGRGAASQAKERVAADAQREQELKSLQLAADEARQAATVAKRQVATAQAGLNLAALQRQAALLRHEHAAQNLEFLRHRSLNAEQWFRLAEGVRSVSQTYLRYSIELAFLAEQAYEFEADKRINVIRFDYDLSDVGDYLAADFLLRDLDTLEQDLIVTQRQRQQHVRYVLSMARECPEALKEVRESGSAIFTVRLEQLEKRHPGLYNLRIGAVDVEPIALIDATRFSMELTHLGTSHVRLKASPDMPSGQASPSPLNTNELTPPPGGWLAALAATWPVKLRITAPEAVVFSGLSRTDAAAVFSFAAASQRQPFDGLGAASSWRVDLSARDNQVVPGSLADVLIAFTLSGYHDAALRHAVDTAPRPMMAGSRWLSGRSNFPDALYEFHRSGRMVWNVPHRLLALTDRLGTVRNVGVALSPMASVQGTVMGRVMNRWQLRLRIMPAGELKVLTDIPTLGFELGEQATALVLTARADFAAGAPARVTWDFGDGSPRAEGLTAQHTYAKPGRYIVTAHAHRDGRLLQLRAHVVAARAHRARMVSPVTAFPRLTRGAGGDVPAGHTRVVGEVVAPADDPVSGNWRIGDRSHTNVNRAVFDLTPGDYTLAFSAVRPLKGRLSCTQRQPEGPPLAFDGLRLSSNRRFDEDGVETTGVGSNPPANPLTVHLFMDALSPADEWTLELPADVNPCLRTISSSDVEQFGLPEIEDVVLVLEYDATPS